MSELDRIQTLLQIKQPRIKEFLRDYDKLRHGKVSYDQFFRAFEAGNVQFTDEETQYIIKKFGEQTNVGNFINYRAALDELYSKEIDSQKAALSGSLSGATFSHSGHIHRRSSETEEILQKLIKGNQSHPIIGKDFFSDYDAHNDGIINANQFSRGLSTIYEAFFRYSPTPKEIKLMIEEFNVNRLKQINKPCMEVKEISTAFNQQTELVDYRAFCYSIGAAKVVDLVEVEKQKQVDPGFKEYYQYPSNAVGEQAMSKLLVAYQKFRFDFKSFLQGKDRRKIGKIPIKDFVQALSGAISDFKRINVLVQELENIAYLFVPEIVYIKDANCKPTKDVDKDQTLVEYRYFLNRLFYDVPQETLMLAESQQTKKQKSQAVETVAAFVVAHPIPFRAEFQKFDKRQTGKVTAANFKQVISQFIPLHHPDNVTANKELNKTSFKIERNLIGIDFKQLEELIELYAVDTTSGLGTVDKYTASPDKLCGSGFLIDYLTFINDIQCETGDFVPNKPAIKRRAVEDELICPDPAKVYYKVADSICQKHLKLSDCLNQGEAGSTKWNRTTFGKIGARNVQRALSSMLDITITDLELAALCFDCETPDGLKMHVYLQDRFHETGAEHHLLIEKDELTQILDKCEISVELLNTNIKTFCDQWNPKRNMCYSYQSGVGTQKQVVLKAEVQERDGLDVTLAAAKHMKNHANECTGHLLTVLGENEIVNIKGQQIKLGQLTYYADNGINDSVVAASCPALLQLYYELHISRAQPIVSFQEFDKLRNGYVTPDQFARAFVLAGLKKVVDFYPKAFSALTDLYTEKASGRFQSLIDYSYMLRDLSKPPTKSLSMNLKEMEVQLKKDQSKMVKKDYATVAKETNDTIKKQKYDATIQGIIEEITPLALKYRPKLRSFFWDFDKRRSGVCEASKVPAALTMMQVKLNAEQTQSLQKGFESQRNGYSGCFEWLNFVELLEESVGQRL